MAITFPFQSASRVFVHSIPSHDVEPSSQTSNSFKNHDPFLTGKEKSDFLNCGLAMITHPTGSSMTQSLFTALLGRDVDIEANALGW